MKSTSTLILLAHGSRAPETLEEMVKLATKLQRGQRGLNVIPAFLNLVKPDLEQAIGMAVAKGAKKVHILPLFLFTGKHVRDDIPALIQANQRVFPEVQLVLKKAIGRHGDFAKFVLKAGGFL